MSNWLIRAIGAVLVTATIAAVCQELEKPREKRRWRGKLGVLPYAVRLPLPARIKETFWNAKNESIFGKPLFGVGWGINFYTLLEKLRIMGDFYMTEDDFLMPTESLRKILENRPVMP